MSGLSYNNYKNTLLIAAGETGTIPGHTAQNAGHQKVILYET